MRHLPALAAGILAIGLLSGCASEPEGPRPAVIQATVAAPTPLSTPAPTVTASAPANPAAAALLPCESVLTATGYQTVAGLGLTLQPATLRPTDYPIVTRFAEGGSLCMWSGAGATYVMIGQLAMDQAAWDAERTALLGQGWVVNDARLPGFLDGPDADPANDEGRGLLFENGVLYYTSIGEALDFLAPIQG